MKKAGSVFRFVFSCRKVGSVSVGFLYKNRKPNGNRTEAEPKLNRTLVGESSVSRRKMPYDQHFEGFGVNMLVSRDAMFVWYHGATWPGL